MTQSQPRVRLFFRDHPILALVALMVAVLLVCAGAATIFGGWFGLNDSSESAASKPDASEPSVTETSDPSEDTGYTVDPEEHRETGDLTEDILCSTNQPAEQYEALVARILDYEEARLTPGFEADQATMRLFATEEYIKSHSRAVDPDDPTDLTVSLDRAQSTVSCYVVSDSRIIVQAWPVFSTHRVNEAGESELVNQFTNPLVHATGWSLVDGVWLVDADIR